MQIYFCHYQKIFYISAKMMLLHIFQNHHCVQKSVCKTHKLEDECQIEENENFCVKDILFLYIQDYDFFVRKNVIKIQKKKMSSELWISCIHVVNSGSEYNILIDHLLLSRLGWKMNCLNMNRITTNEQ